jgi:hypothetical protein
MSANLFLFGHWGARIIPTGSVYGLSAVNKYDAPLIQFYDCDYIRPDVGWPYGQPVSQYFLSTFMGIREGGLDLDSGVDKWTLSEDQVNAFQAYAVSWLIEGSICPTS